MRTNLLLVSAITLGAAFVFVNASAETYTSTCAGDIEDGTTWGVDPETFELHADDELVINHELTISTKYLAPDVEIGNLRINEGAKLLIHFSGDDYSTARGLNVHGNLVNYGCLGFDRLGSFSNHHDDAVAGGYGRLWLSLWGNLENHGIINTNSLFLRGENQTISSTEKMQISEFCPKGSKGIVKALSDISLYNTKLSRWAGSVEESEFDALDMNGHTLTLTADAPTEPGVWWYSPEWNGYMSDMKILFGKGGKLVINDCYVSNNVFNGDNIQLASDSHGFFFEHNLFNGNVDIVSGNVHVACTTWIDAFEVHGNLVNHGSVNSADIIYPGKGLDGTDYHMLYNGDKGRIHSGDFLVCGNFENVGDFGLGYIYDKEMDDRSKVRMCSLGKDITIKGEITAELAITQAHPLDDYLGTYNTYDGKPLDKKGSVSVKDYLNVKHFQTYTETTFVIPENAVFYNNAEPQSEPLIVRNGNNNEDRGLWNGVIKNRGTLTCLYTEPQNDYMESAQHINFPEWARWSFDGKDDFWQVSDHVDYLEITECGMSMGEGVVSRSWDINVHGHDYAQCLHDLTLYYDDEDLNGLNENELHLFQSFDNGKTWRQVSNDNNIFREPENNKVQVVRYDTPQDSWIEGFGRFILATNIPSGIQTLQSDMNDADDTRCYDLTGRQVRPDYKGIMIMRDANTSKVIRM